MAVGSGNRNIPKLRNSERGTFNICKWRWDLEFNERLKPQVAAPALRFGTLVHASLASYYKLGVKRGPHPRKTFERLYKKELERAESFGFRDEDGVWVEAGEMGVAMLNGYIETYGDDSQYEVVMTEQKFTETIRRPHDPCQICNITLDPYLNCDPQCPGPSEGKPWFRFVGVMDGVWRDLAAPKPTYFIIDHKTAKAIDTKYLAMDEQASAYWTFGLAWALRRKLIPKDSHISGMLFNFMRKAIPDDRPTDAEGRALNKDGSISKNQPSPYFVRQPVWRDELDRLHHRARSLQQFRHMELIRSGVLPAYKSPGLMQCRGCWAFDICELHETGNDWEEMLRATTSTWDPYTNEEIYEGR